MSWACFEWLPSRFMWVSHKLPSHHWNLIKMEVKLMEKKPINIGGTVLSTPHYLINGDYWSCDRQIEVIVTHPRLLLLLLLRFFLYPFLFFFKKDPLNIYQYHVVKYTGGYKIKLWIWYSYYKGKKKVEIRKLGKVQTTHIVSFSLFCCALSRGLPFSFF